MEIIFLFGFLAGLLMGFSAGYAFVPERAQEDLFYRKRFFWNLGIVGKYAGLLMIAAYAFFRFF